MSDAAFKQIARAFLDALYTGSDDTRTRIDWPRWRLMQLMQGTAGVDTATREQLLQRGFVELGKGNFGVDAEERAVRGLRSLVEILLPRGWRFVDGYDNPMLAALRGGPVAGAPPTKYPALPRLWELTQDALAGADEVTYAGAKRVTLLFVGDRLAGVLDAR